MTHREWVPRALLAGSLTLVLLAGCNPFAPAPIPPTPTPPAEYIARANERYQSGVDKLNRGDFRNAIQDLEEARVYMPANDPRIADLEQALARARQALTPTPRTTPSPVPTVEGTPSPSRAVPNVALGDRTFGRVYPAVVPPVASVPPPTSVFSDSEQVAVYIPRLAEVQDFRLRVFRDPQGQFVAEVGSLPGLSPPVEWYNTLVWYHEGPEPVGEYRVELFSGNTLTNVMNFAVRAQVAVPPPAPTTQPPAVAVQPPAPPPAAPRPPPAPAAPPAPPAPPPPTPIPPPTATPTMRPIAPAALGQGEWRELSRIQSAAAPAPAPMGRDLQCSDFAYQEDAQAVLGANRADTGELDPDRDGVACDRLPHRPQTEAGLIRALAFSPNFASNREMVAGAERGIYRSGDAGRVWQQSRVPANLPAVRTVAYSPRTGHVFAGAYGEEGGEARRGVYRSTDGGTSFNEFSLMGRSVSGLYFSPDGSTMYATTRPGGGEPGSMYRSTDEGQTWAPVLNLGSQSLVFSALVFSPTYQVGQDRVIYAGAAGFPLSVPTPVAGVRAPAVRPLACPSSPIDNDSARPFTYGTVFRSDDDGRTWNVDDAVEGGGRLRSVWSLTGIGQGGAWELYAGTDCGVLTKRNGAASWRQVSPADPIAQQNYAVDLAAPRPGGVAGVLCPQHRVETPIDRASIEWRDCITSVWDVSSGGTWSRIPSNDMRDAQTIGVLTNSDPQRGTPAMYLGVSDGRLYLYSVPAFPS